MSTPLRSKVKASHLSRDAYLYVRQSTLRQVAENQESTRRQYALRERAIALGWRSEQVVVVDNDLGLSAATGCVPIRVEKRRGVSNAWLTGAA